MITKLRIPGFENYGRKDKKFSWGEFMKIGKSWALSFCIIAGAFFFGCGYEAPENDEDECSGSACETPDPIGHLTGSWLAESAYRYSASNTNPQNTYSETGTGVRKETFIINDADQLKIYTCALDGILTPDGVYNIRNTSDQLTFDYRDAHYELDKTGFNTMEGRFTDERHFDNETESEDGTVTFRRFKMLQSDADIIVGVLTYHLNDLLDTTYLACFMENRTETSSPQFGTAKHARLAMAGLNSAGEFEGFSGDISYPDNAPDDGWREFIFHLSGHSVNAMRDGAGGDSNLSFSFKSEYKNDSVNFTFSSEGTGEDASADAFEFDVGGDARFDLSGRDVSGDGSSDASSDAP